MITMINCASDFTYDFFVEDAKLYKAKPIKGVHCRNNASNREKFMTYLKDMARDFKQEWTKDKHLYDRYYGWIGNAFERELSNSLFSDLYKDTYGQRPHLPYWYYITLLDLPHGEDVIRTFCETPIEDACRNAKEIRNYFNVERN